MSLKNREGKRLDEVTMKEEDCYGGRDFFFFIDGFVLGLLELMY